jgi:hypothetical protein
MVPKIENVFDGFHVTVAVPASQRLSSAQRNAVKTTLGNKGSVSLQKNCAVAEATNEAFGAVYNTVRSKISDREVLDFGDRGQFVLNNTGPARFGIDKRGHIFLTVSLVEDTDAKDAARYRLTWRDTAIPEELARIAAAHDQGQPHDYASVDLFLGDATLMATPAPAADKRPNTAARRAQKNGKADHRGLPRKHRRICDADIERLYAAT